MLTDEIMNQIEMKTGVPRKQQRITYQSKHLTTQQALNYHNIQENDTIDLSLELQGGTGTTDPTEQPGTDTEESATQPKDRQSNDEHQKQESTYPNQQTWTPQSSNSNTRWKDWQGKITTRS